MESDFEMNLMRYLLEYTLETICHGNRSECARRMGMEYAEFKKLRNRINEGGSSNRMTEALLEMYWREHLSLDEALKAYTNSYFGADMELAESACDEILQAIHSAVEEQRRMALTETNLLNAAGRFLEELERSFCHNLCQRGRYLECACPTRRFLEYLQWLRGEMIAEAPSASPK